MSDDVTPLLFDQGAADLAPLRNSHEADQLETELKALFMAMFAQFVRPALDEVATVGTPHLGSIDQLERAVKVDGFALQRNGDEGAMRYLHKAFRARNPKRGLHMLRTYLQLIFGEGNWELIQRWQDAAQPYPTALSPTAEPNHFLTTRIEARVISTGLARTPELMAQAFRSVLPARMLLDVRLIAYPFASSVRLYLAAVAQANILKFVGDFIDPPFRLDAPIQLAAFATSTASVVRIRFTGNFE